MSNKSNEPMREPIDDDAVSQEGDVWPPAPDAKSIGRNLPAGGGGATGSDAEFAWLEETAELEKTMDTLKSLTGADDSPQPVELNLNPAPDQPHPKRSVAKAGRPDARKKAKSQSTAGKAARTVASRKGHSGDAREASAKPAPDSPASRAPLRQPARRVRADAEGELGQLWTNVFFSGELEPPKAVVVAAARQGDGATQIAVSLALLGAEANPELSIALVDLNLRRPTIHSLVGVSQQPGVTDVLAGRASLAQAIQTIDLANGAHLHVVSSGPAADHPLSFIKSRQLKSLMGQLRDRFDHTIFDVASADRHPDAQAVGMQTDGVLLVVNAGGTPRETVADARKRLDLAGARCLGLVLNQRTDPIPAMLYNMT